MGKGFQGAMIICDSSSTFFGSDELEKGMGFHYINKDFDFLKIVSYSAISSSSLRINHHISTKSRKSNATDKMSSPRYTSDPRLHLTTRHNLRF